MKGSGSEGEGAGQDEVGGVGRGCKLSMMCWNVGGWGKKDGSDWNRMEDVLDMRAKVVDLYRPDIIAVVETWLRGEEVIEVDGYRWVGRNRRGLHRKAVRGSGGVGLLIKEEVLESYTIEILESDVEDILWVRIRQVEEEEEEALVLAVCYIPPESSSRGVSAEDVLQSLAEQVARFRAQGPMILCGDFNARCGSLDADCERLPSRKVIDVVKNSQGETFVDFLSSVNMAVVNGRKGQDAFTCISSKGCSVVDYCIVGVDNFELIDNFKVLTMSECVEGMQCRGDISRIPDHSIIQWEVFVDGMVRKEIRSDQHVGKMRLRVPESYLENEVERVNGLTEKLRGVGKDQKAVDEIYDEVVRVMKQGLVEERVQRVKRGQPWFSRELAQCRKEFHRAERERWIDGRNGQL